MSRRWNELAAGPRARIFTILLVSAQIGALALDAIDQQAVVQPFLCPLSWDVYEAGVEIACVVTLLLFVASPIVGLLSLRFHALRPIYWTLLLLVPVGIGGQILLMHALGLDHPRIHHG